MNLVGLAIQASDLSVQSDLTGLEVLVLKKCMLTIGEGVHRRPGEMP